MCHSLFIGTRKNSGRYHWLQIDKEITYILVSRKLYTPCAPKTLFWQWRCSCKCLIDCLKEWILSSNMQATCLDATTSNAGDKQATGALVGSNDRTNTFSTGPSKWNFNQIIISDVFNKCRDVYTGPNILSFKRFQNSLQTITKEVFACIYENNKSNFVGKYEIVALCKTEVEK